MKPKFLSLLLVLALLLPIGAAAQNKVALKTNLLHDATLSPNLALEWGFARNWSVEVSGSYHPEQFNVFGNMQLNHWLVQPGVRYWFCERFNGAFISVNGLFGQVQIGGFPLDMRKFSPKYGVDLNSYLLVGDKTWGAGLSAGYDLVLGRHWNIEFELGLGYVDAIGPDYEMTKGTDGKYFLAEGTKPYYTGHHDYIGPTRLSIAIVYLF